MLQAGKWAPLRAFKEDQCDVCPTPCCWVPKGRGPCSPKEMRWLTKPISLRGKKQVKEKFMAGKEDEVRNLHSLGWKTWNNCQKHPQVWL